MNPFERFFRRELYPPELHIQGSYQALFFALNREDQAETATERLRRIHEVHRRLLNLHATIESTRPIPERIWLGRVEDYERIYYSSEAALKKVPYEPIGTAHTGGRLLLVYGKAEVLDPVEWCQDVRLVRKLADGMISPLPRVARSAIKNQTPLMLRSR